MVIFIYIFIILLSMLEIEEIFRFCLVTVYVCVTVAVFFTGEKVRHMLGK